MSFESYFPPHVQRDLLLMRLLAIMEALRVGRRSGARLVCKSCGRPNGRSHPWDCYGPITRPGWQVEEYE